MAPTRPPERRGSLVVCCVVSAFLPVVQGRLGGDAASSRTLWLQQEPPLVEPQKTDADAQRVAAVAQQALAAQQTAMLVLAKQQAELVQEEEAMEAKEKEMALAIAAIEVERGDPEGPAPSWFSNGCCAPVRAFRWYWSYYTANFQLLLLAMLLYLILLLFAGWFYKGQLRKRRVDPVGRNPDDWYFSLVDARECCGRDQMLCCCACCCLPVRWAATAASSKVKFIPYWPALFLFATLLLLGPFTAGLTVVAALGFAVALRHKIRDLWNIGKTKYKLSWIALDCVLWTCCPCLAAIQEAREIEYSNAY
mmetsp:Transcript_38767/g.89493  ORF Transcript_38767/g.89493 Transcript_38767/m.89493 type:complete len:308 (-) Transcript_38767:98-1021(-)